MSSRIFQSGIVQMKEATDRCIGIVDADGFVVACSELSMIGSRIEGIQTLAETSKDRQFTTDIRTFKLLGSINNQYDYAVFVDGVDEFARCICVLAAVAFDEAKTSYEEKHNIATFVKNIISDNILPGDVYVRAKELHFETEIPRAVFLVRQSDRPNVAAVDTVQSMFTDKHKDFVINVNETDIVVIKELSTVLEAPELNTIAQGIEKCLENELGVKSTIGVGTVAMHLRELADRYKEAQTAIEVGKVFDTDKTVINYENLGIGRIIYQLPITLCEMFLSEVFKKNPIESLDQETLITISKFFENNLNVSETSRKLFVHRNTLVYRLEKIKKLTGLDLREFDHAIVFKVALMVKRYLNSQGVKY